MKYPPCRYGCLTADRKPVPGHGVAGSLTGAVASQSVTEARDGELRAVGNRAQSVKAARELDCETDMSSRCGSRP